MNRKFCKKIIFLLFLVVLILSTNRPLLAASSPVVPRQGGDLRVCADYQKDIEETQKKIEEQQKRKEDLEKQQKIYQQKIKEKRKEGVTLKNELIILGNQINKQKIAIRMKENEIEIADLEIKNTQFKILQKQKEIIEQKNKISEVLRLISQHNRKGILEIVVLADSLADILSQNRRFNSLQESLISFLDDFKEKKDGLIKKEKEIQTERQNLVFLKRELENEKAKLNSNKIVQTKILDETRGAEWRFQSLLAEAITEQKNIEREISALERQLREKLTYREEAGLMEEEGEIIFSWPVSSGVITAYFHDPDYPYRRWIGEHSGLDLRAEQGAPVRAAASGYIGRARHGGLGYSYVLIVHNEDFATPYGHLSQINVEEGSYIRRGEVIGKSGGMPGTSGAGYFSTGPHLHFEVRLKGIPVNPLNYLL